MLKVVTKLAIAAAVVGLAMAGTSDGSLAKGAKKPASCVPEICSLLPSML